MPRAKPKKYEAVLAAHPKDPAERKQLEKDTRKLIRKIEDENKQLISKAGKKQLSFIIDRFRARREQGFFKNRPSQGSVNARLRVMLRHASSLFDCINVPDDRTRISLGAHELLERLSDDLARLKALAKHALAVNTGRKAEVGNKMDYARWDLLHGLCEFYVAETGKRLTAYYSQTHRGVSAFMRIVFAIVEAADPNINNRLSQSEKDELRKDAGKVLQFLAEKDALRKDAGEALPK